MSWSSSFFPSVDKLSIPLSTPSIAANDTLPEHILSSFHSLSMEDLQQINNSLGQQPHESNLMINLLNNSTYNLFNDHLVDLIGCLVYNLIHSKHIFHIFTTCPIFQLEISKSLLTDVVWFWGTQVCC